METGWDRLVAGQLSTGAVPGPPYDPQLADEPDADKRKAMTFRTCYHTTVAAASFGEAAKWVARLRVTAEADDDRQILLKVETDAGHGGVSGRYDQWTESAFRMPG